MPGEKEGPVLETSDQVTSHRTLGVLPRRKRWMEGQERGRSSGTTTVKGQNAVSVMVTTAGEGQGTEFHNHLVLAAKVSCCSCWLRPSRVAVPHVEHAGTPGPPLPSKPAPGPRVPVCPAVTGSCSRRPAQKGKPPPIRFGHA